eukprot:2821993-Prymnesium_polylepis.2
MARSGSMPWRRRSPSDAFHRSATADGERTVLKSATSSISPTKDVCPLGVRSQVAYPMSAAMDVDVQRAPSCSVGWLTNKVRLKPFMAPKVSRASIVPSMKVVTAPD